LVNGGGHYGLNVGSGFATVWQPAGIAGDSAGYIETTFTVSGNFFVTLTEDNSGLAPESCGYCNVAEFSAFVAQIGNQSAEALVESLDYGDCYGGAFDGHVLGCDVGGAQIKWGIGRVGDVVSLYWTNPGQPFGAPFAQSVMPTQDATFYFDLCNCDGTGNSNAGQVVFSDFSVRADKIIGLGQTPEPSTWLLALSGLGFIGTLRRKYSKQR